jgi:hypothetical protein
MAEKMLIKIHWDDKNSMKMKKKRKNTINGSAMGIPPGIHG